MEKIKDILAKVFSWYVQKALWLKAVIGAGVLFVLTFLGMMVHTATLIRPDISSADVTGRDYNEMVHYLEEQGFTNVKTETLADLDEGTKESQVVEQVSIDGETDFEKEDRYAATVPVIVTYHTFSKNAIDYSKVDVAGGKEKAQKNLKASGFTNVVLVEKALTSGAGSDLGTMTVKINGDEPQKDHYYAKNSKVEVEYTTLSPKAVNLKDLTFSSSEDFSAVVAKLEKLGFTNITTLGEKVKDTAKNNKFSKLLVAGIEVSEKSDQIVSKDAAIIVKYSDASEKIAEEEAKKAEEARKAAEEEERKQQAEAAAQQAAQQAAEQQAAEQAAADSQPNVYYKNCTAAKAAGAAPLYSGQPGYARHLDRDGDGVACEY